MLLNLILASFAALAVGVVPGWFWATLLRAPVDLAERAALSVAFSMALVPAVVLVPTRLLGLSVTLPVAVGSALAVFVAGLAAHLRFGAAKGTEGPLLPSPAVPLSTPALVPLVAALGLALGVMVGALPADAVLPAITGELAPTRSMVLVIALLVLAAGVLQLIFPRSSAETVEPASLLPAVSPMVRRVLLPAILLLVLARGYIGPILHDWPFMRGVDHYSHAVMANRMMDVGRIEPYLIYPPGFHTMTASISRLTGLDPLEIFPVLGPALLLLPALALYTLGTRLWGWGYGVAAAFFTVLLGGTYYYFNDAMYPNLVTSQFLLVMALASLVMVYRAPSARNGLSLAILGSAVVLYHPVASMYLAALLALVGLFFALPLLFRDRPRGLTLTLSLSLLGALSVAYAWHTYGLGSEFSKLLGGSGGETGEAVGMAVNTQAAYPEGFLIGTMVSQPVAWLGLLGAFLLVVTARDSFGMPVGMPAALAHLTVFLWAVLLFAGSRLTVTGFPQRFGRDLGVPLALLAALGLIAVLKSLGPGRRPAAVFAASAVVLLSLALAGTGAAQSLWWSSRPSIQMTITPAIAEAGRWLKENNEGGNIMISPHVNQVPSRMMLAMGDYSALQSFEYAQVLRPRDLPPTGPEPLMDVLRTVNNPTGERVTSVFEKYDVRYVVLYKNMPDRPTADYWRRFEARPDLYPAVFENRDVIIVSTG